MPEIISAIRTLLNRQLEATQVGMHNLSKSQWSDYHFREAQIAILVESVAAERPHACRELVAPAE
jgi:hypothetical protein